MHPDRETSQSPEQEPALAAPGDAGSRDVGGWTILTTGIWIGAIVGPLEVFARLVRGFIDPRVAELMLRTNRHWTWMVLSADLALFAAMGVLLAITVRIRPSRAHQRTFFVLGLSAALAVLRVFHGLHPIAACVLALGVASSLARLSDSIRGSFRRRILPAWPLLVLAVAGASIYEYRRVERSEARAVARLPKARPGAPNVLFLVLDTVRADALTSYGYERDTTPNLARLAKRGVQFQQARSAAPWTLPSHATMFTGRWPHELNVGRDRAMGREFPTLAESLSARGYRTAGFVGNTHFCSPEFGLARGFTHYEDDPANERISVVEVLQNASLGRAMMSLAGRAGVALTGLQGLRKDAATINTALLKWLDRPAAGDRPFFAFINYIDAHDPYALPAGAQPRFPGGPETPADFRLLAAWAHRPKLDLAPRDLRMARTGYDNCLGYLDDQIGRLLDELERRRVLDDTIVVVTSDHGESFGEHQLFGHGRSLYRPEIHVPLIVAGPASFVPEGRKVREPVSLRSLPSTILGLVDPSPSRAFPGRSLAALWSAGTGPGTDTILSEVSIPDGERFVRSPIPAYQGAMSALVHAGRVYIRNASGREEVYDLDADPAEAYNLAALPHFRDDLKGLRAQREKHFGTLPQPELLAEGDGPVRR